MSNILDLVVQPTSHLTPSARHYAEPLPPGEVMYADEVELARAITTRHSAESVFCLNTDWSTSNRVTCWSVLIVDEDDETMDSFSITEELFDRLRVQVFTEQPDTMGAFEIGTFFVPMLRKSKLLLLLNP